MILNTTVRYIFHFTAECSIDQVSFISSRYFLKSAQTFVPKMSDFFNITDELNPQNSYMGEQHKTH